MSITSNLPSMNVPMNCHRSPIVCTIADTIRVRLGQRGDPAWKKVAEMQNSEIDIAKLIKLAGSQLSMSEEACLSGELARSKHAA